MRLTTPQNDVHSAETVSSSIQQNQHKKVRIPVIFLPVLRADSRDTVWSCSQV